MPQPWRISMFGELTARRDSVVVTEFPHRKVAALLAFLARQPERTHSREELAREFWPDKDLAQGQSSLSNSLSLLRKQLELPSDPRGSVLRTDKGTIGLNPAVIHTDLADFQDCMRRFAGAKSLEVRRGALEEANLLYLGDMLPELTQDWIQAERVRLARMYVHALLSVSYECDKGGDFDNATKYAKRATRSSLLHRRIKTELYDLYILAHEYLMRLSLKNDPSPGDGLERARENWKQAISLAEQVGLHPSESGLRLWENLNSYGFADPSFLILPSPDAAVRNLPVLENRRPEPSRQFVGRDREIRRILQFLFGLQPEQTLPATPPPFKNRLITLVGPSGYGKTCLAQHIQRVVTGPTGIYPDLSCCFVPLTYVSDASMIASAIMEALSITRSPDLDPRHQVRKVLGQYPQTLLILDGADGIEKAVSTVEDLLADVPDVACLVTAHGGLGGDRERIVPINALDLPNTDGPYEEVRLNPCVALFEGQARSVRPDFALTKETVPVVARLCRLLRGIPLAIVVAAARVASFAPADILRNLMHDRDVWSQSVAGEDLVSRTLYWTYHLLSPSLQDFFVRLSVFKNGWTAAAAREVCGQNGPEPLAESYLGELARCRLVEVVSAPTSSKTRYRLLEEPEKFTSERSAAVYSALRRRHARYFLSLVKDPCFGGRIGDLDGPLTAAALDEFAEEQDNLYRALEWSLRPENWDEAAAEEGSGAIGVALAARLWRYWNQRNLYREGLAWLATAMEVVPATAEDRLEIYNGAGILALNLQDDRQAHKWLIEGQTLAEGLERRVDAQSVGRMANSIGYWHRYRSQQPDELDPEGQQRAAMNWYRKSIRYYKTVSGAGQLWPYHGIGKLLQKRAERFADQSRHAAGVIERAEYRRKARRCSTRASIYFERSLAIARQYGDDQGQSHVLESLATLLWSTDRSRIHRDNPLAVILLEQCLRIRRALKDISSLASAVEIYSFFAFDRGDFVLAATMDGVSHAMRKAVGIPPYARALAEQKERQMRAQTELAKEDEDYDLLFRKAVSAYREQPDQFLLNLLKTA